MSHTVIRFPTAAKFDKPPMATPVSWRVRFERWLFGHRKPLTPTGWKIQRARNGR